MKRYLLSTFTIAAAALLVTSCNDEMDNGLKTGDEGTVTFTAQLLRKWELVRLPTD